MMVPTVHSNGTGRRSLLEELTEAHTAVQAAMTALRQVTVHGRDYYVQGPNAYAQAREEMDRRQVALAQVADELYEMYQAIDRQ